MPLRAIEERLRLQVRCFTPVFHRSHILPFTLQREANENARKEIAVEVERIRSQEISSVRRPRFASSWPRLSLRLICLASLRGCVGADAAGGAGSLPARRRGCSGVHRAKVQRAAGGRTKGVLCFGAASTYDVLTCVALCCMYDHSERKRCSKRPARANRTPRPRCSNSVSCCWTRRSDCTLASLSIVAKSIWTPGMVRVCCC